MSRSTARRRAEAVLALVLAAIIIVPAIGALVFFLTISPVHTDPAAVPSTPHAPPPERYERAVGEARRQARSLLVDGNLPGLSVAVAVDGEIVWAEGFGWADVSRRAAVTPLTLFRIGSVSIPVTAAAVGLLYERGRLDLDAPIRRYVPSFPPKEWEFTTRQLMGHVAGVRGPRFEYESLPTGHCGSVDEGLRIFSADPLLFRPGTEYRPSPYGWILVSAVVEAAAGQPYLEFITREILEPLGMEDTVPDDPDGVADGASLYFPRAFARPDLGLQDEAPRADYSCWAGAAAFVSTPSDLARFGAAMLKPGLLTAETIALVQSPLRLESGASTGYGLGWRVESVELAGAPARLVGHRSGSPAGATASLMTFPDAGLVVAVASNVSFARGIDPFGLKVAEVFARKNR